MRPFATTAALGIILLSATGVHAQGNGWTSGGTYGHPAPIKTPHVNKAKEASKMTGAKVKPGTPSGASSGSQASGAHSHPLHGAGSDQWH